MVSKSKKHILWFKDCSSKDLPRVGGKNANLGEMLRLGLRVPPGFAGTTYAFDTFVERGRVRDQIVRTLSQIPPENVQALEKAGQTVRDLIESTPIPVKIVKEIG